MPNQSASIWETLCETFDEKLPRRTAVALKPTDSTILYAYPASLGKIGWFFDDRIQSGYDETVAFECYLGPWLSRGVAPQPVAHSSFVWATQEYRPDLVQRRALYSDHGLIVQERFGRAVEGAFTWQFEFGNRALQVCARSLFVVLKARRGLGGIRREGDCFVGKEVALTAAARTWGAYDHLENVERDIMAGQLSGRADGDRYLILEVPLSVPPQGRQDFALGLAFGDAGAATRAREVPELAAPIRERWDAWLQSLPAAEFRSPEEALAYYKCWWIVRLNYYTSPRFGHMVCEALPVYRGYWLWGLDASEWHSDQDTHQTSVHIRQALELFLAHQRADGYVTHAMYLDEEKLGERWSQRDLTQTPHIPWVALRYAECTGDHSALARWYPQLVRFYDYLCRTRDQAFRNLHLWAILSSFDTGLDTTAAFQKVTYGDADGKEAYCYPAIFAAERCRYEQALARMAELLGTGEQARWLAAAEQTRQAMDAVLWDTHRNWYGVLHADGTLDTRVGVDGLFPLAYGLVGPERAAAARENVHALIGHYGIHTVAPGERGYEAHHYWRGPAWPKSCAMGLVAARRYYPELVEPALASTLRMLLRWPSVWECLNAETGDVARGDQGLCATPVIASNVGAGEALGALLTVRGVDMLAFDGTLRLAPVRNFHWAGLRLDLQQRDGAWQVTVRAAEKTAGTLRLRTVSGQLVALEVIAGRSYTVSE
ncbi:MAG: hypothetical protein HZA31_09990 [Opitutae bacterium]|nr:hypothetical protein [Opitutae bacterium]